MLEVLIAANSAFAIIKKTLENTREISSCGSQIASFIGAEDKLRADVQRKKNSLWTKFLGKEDNELEEFMALEEIRRKQDMLREYMQLYGRANLYTDYIEFCAEARRNRKEANKKQAQRKAYIQDVITKIILGLLITILISGFAGAAFLIMRKKGMI